VIAYYPDLGFTSHHVVERSEIPSKPYDIYHASHHHHLHHQFIVNINNSHFLSTPFLLYPAKSFQSSSFSSNILQSCWSTEIFWFTEGSFSFERGDWVIHLDIPWSLIGFDIIFVSLDRRDRACSGICSEWFDDGIPFWFGDERAGDHRRWRAGHGRRKCDTSGIGLFLSSRSQ
jgi:hypothetical protein